MRKFLVAMFAMLFLLGSSAGIVVAQTDDDDATPDSDADTVQVDDSTPDKDENADDEDADTDEDDATASADANPVNPQMGDAVTYFASNGDPQLTFTVTDAFRDWDEYDEYSEPDRGVTYLAIELEIENISDDGFEIDPYRFGLQDAQGFFFGNAYVSPAEETSTEVLTESVIVDGGETWEGVIIFEVFDNQELRNLYWNESGILLTLGDLSEV
jgi:hypothetical protein